MNLAVDLIIDLTVSLMINFLRIKNVYSIIDLIIDFIMNRIMVKHDNRCKDMVQT